MKLNKVDSIIEGFERRDKALTIFDSKDLGEILSEYKRHKKINIGDAKDKKVLESLQALKDGGLIEWQE